MKLRTTLLILTLGIVACTPMLNAAAQTMPMPTNQAAKPAANSTTQNQAQPNQDQHGKMGQGNMTHGKMGQGNMGHGKMGQGSATHSKMGRKKHAKGHKPVSVQKMPQ